MIGAKDYVFTMIFENDSELKKKLGAYSSAKLYYTKKEREKFNSLNDQKIDEICNNNIRVEVINSQLSTEDKISFQLDGLDCSEINHIIYLPYSRDDEIDSDGLKSIPKIQIPYESKSKLEYENIFVGFYSRLISKNIKLLYEEQMEYIGLDFAFNDGKSRSELLKIFGVDPNDIQKDYFMRVAYYKAKEKIQGLNEVEKEDLKNYEDALWYKKVTAFLKELIKSGKLTDEVQDYQEKVGKIFTELKKFKTTRLFGFREPLIYMSVESYLHIIMRHFRDTKLGDNNISKSEIPYKIDDLKYLIENVIEKISDELTDHFKKNENGKFYRTGNRAVYYKGDYYSIDIDASGELISFYKN